MSAVELGISASSMESKLDSGPLNSISECTIISPFLPKLAEVGPAVQFRRTGILLLGSHLSRQHYRVFQPDQKSCNIQGGEDVSAGKAVSRTVGGPGTRAQGSANGFISSLESQASNKCPDFYI